MIGVSEDVAKSLKNIPEHKMPASIANTDKNHTSNCSVPLILLVFIVCPAIPNDKPNVLKQIPVKSLDFELCTDLIILRVIANSIIATAHTLNSGICKMDENNVDFRWRILGTTKTFL